MPYNCRRRSVFYTCKESNGEYIADSVRFFSFDMASGECKEWAAFDGLGLYADEENHCIYHLSVSDKIMVTLDVTTSLVSENPISGLDAGVLNSHYEPNTKMFYFTTANGIYRWDGNGEASLYRDNKDVRRFIPLSDDRLAAVKTGEIKIYGFQGSSAGAAGITVMGFDSVYRANFTQSTGIAVEKRDQAHADIMEDIAQFLTNQDGSVDIFAIWSDAGFSSAKDKGYFADLSASEILSAASDELFPAFRAVITADNGALVAWPFLYMHT